MTCSLCGKERPLVKAHVIPEAFFREQRTEKEPPLLVTNTPGVYPKRAPIGVYDRSILCVACEAKFGALDSYAADVLLNRRDHFFKALSKDNQTVGFVAEGIDQALLHRFLVAVLWRASASSQPFFKDVKLGRYHELAKQFFLGRAPENAGLFATVLSRWTASEKYKDLTTAMLNPHVERWNGVNAYRIHLGDHTAYIKTDRRPYMKDLREMQIGSRQHLFVVARSLDNNKELRVMKLVADAAPAGKAS